MFLLYPVWRRDEGRITRYIDGYNPGLEIKPRGGEFISTLFSCNNVRSLRYDIGCKSLTTAVQKFSMNSRLCDGTRSREESLADFYFFFWSDEFFRMQSTKSEGFVRYNASYVIRAREERKRSEANWVNESEMRESVHVLRESGNSGTFLLATT